MVNMEHNVVNNYSPSKRTYFCGDVVIAILLKLPVKSLIRFTCVSKSWNSLIHSPDFIATHNKERCRLRRYLLNIHLDPHQITSSVTFICESPGKEATTEQCSMVNLPFDSNYRVIGSCEGLVCFVNFRSNKTYLCNPLFGTFKILPISPYEETTAKQHSGLNNNSIIKLGLGYSCKNNDYRVVKITYTKTKRSLLNKVEIYSLKSDSWKSIDCGPLTFLHGNHNVFINGCIKWVGRRFDLRRRAILWFDIDKELFRETEFPGVLDSFKEIVPYVTTIPEECEEFYCTPDSLWKMKILSCENSWVKLWLGSWNQREGMDVMTFDGTMMIDTRGSEKMISFLGLDVEEEKLKTNNLWHECLIVCVSESLMLLDHQN